MQSVINSNQSKLLDLETLTEFEGHLKYAETAISRLHFPQPLSDSLINQIQTIRERGSDEKLYLAVIGESSTGKTTLINAFLRDEILKAQATTMTTASATILSYDPDLSVEVRFIKENKDEGGFLSGLARLFGPKSNETVIDAPELEFLTENNSAQISTVI